MHLYGEFNKFLLSEYIFRAVATQRDLIWITTLDLIEFDRTFTAKDVRSNINQDAPSLRTIRNALNVMVANGLLTVSGGQGSSAKSYSPVKSDIPETPGYKPRSPTPSTIPYPGSKRGTAQWIIGQMPEHDTYCEVFGGSGAVMFQKPKSKYEIYNDLDGDVTQFYRMTRDRGDELAEFLTNVPYSRETFQRWVNKFHAGFRPDDPIERAGRYFTLRYMQWVGMVSAPNGFKVRARRSPARSFDHAKRRLEVLTNRFSQVIIENRDFDAIMKAYDDTRVTVLMYLDPPYPNKGHYYTVDFDAMEFFDCLGNVDCDWMLSYPVFPDALRREKVTVFSRESRRRMRQSDPEVDELLICNFDPDERSSFVPV